jgi:hypothetical protein
LKPCPSTLTGSAGEWGLRGGQLPSSSETGHENKSLSAEPHFLAEFRRLVVTRISHGRSPNNRRRNFRGNLGNRPSPTAEAIEDPAQSNRKITRPNTQRTTRADVIKFELMKDLQAAIAIAAIILQSRRSKNQAPPNPIFLLSSAVIPPIFWNRSANLCWIFRCSGVSPDGRNRYQRASCSRSAFSTCSMLGSRGGPFMASQRANYLRTQSANRSSCETEESISPRS